MRSSTKAVFLFVTVLLAPLGGCSAMQGLEAVTSGVSSAISPSDSGIYATAQLGKENTNEGDSTIDNRRVEEVSTDAAVDVKDNSGVSNVVSETDNADKSVDNSETKGEDAGVASGDWNADNISLNQIPLSFLILFAVGWILPSPAVIVRGIGSVILFFRDLITGKI